MKEYLQRVLKRIEQPENWCQRHHALDEQGKPCYSRSAKAVCWCLDGAMQAENESDILCDSLHYYPACHALGETAGDDWGWMGLTVFNDQKKHKDVVGLLRRTIEKLN